MFTLREIFEKLLKLCLRSIIHTRYLIIKPIHDLILRFFPNFSQKHIIQREHNILRPRFIILILVVYYVIQFQKTTWWIFSIVRQCRFYILEYNSDKLILILYNFFLLVQNPVWSQYFKFCYKLSALYWLYLLIQVLLASIGILFIFS